MDHERRNQLNQAADPDWHRFDDAIDSLDSSRTSMDGMGVWNNSMVLFRRLLEALYCSGRVMHVNIPSINDITPFADDGNVQLRNHITQLIIGHRRETMLVDDAQSNLITNIVQAMLTNFSPVAISGDVSINPTRDQDITREGRPDGAQNGSAALRDETPASAPTSFTTEFSNNAPYYGFLMACSTTNSANNKEAEFKTAASHSIGSELGVNLDVKVKIPQYGMSLTENQLGTIFEFNGRFGRDLKLTLDSVYAPHAGKRSGKLKAGWSLPTARLTADVAVTSTPVIAFGNSSNKLANSALAFGYTLQSFVVNSTDFGASLFHKVAGNVELGAQLGWKIGGQGADFAIATKYAPSRDVLLRAKVANNSQVAVAVTHSLSNYLNPSSHYNLATNDAHKFGLGLEFNPN